MVEVEVTDADAHAWVEVYEQGRGWYVVDVTPTSDEEEDTENFWDVFDRFMNSGSDSSDEETDDTATGDFHISDEVLRSIGIIILAALLIAFVCLMAFNGFRVVLLNIKYAKANRSDKLIIRYSEFCRRLKRHEKEFKGCHNYNEQIAFICRKNEAAGINIGETVPLGEFEDILERAGFSNKEISEEELDSALAWLKKLGVPKTARK
jgi:hypothetical protein